MRFLIAVLMLVVVARAAERTGQSDIDYLLNLVEKSDCRFIRNGKEFSGHEAAEHLRSKLSAAGQRVQTARDFIDGIASASSLTGRPYQIRLPDVKIVPSAQWFSEALARRNAGAP